MKYTHIIANCQSKPEGMTQVLTLLTTVINRSHLLSIDPTCHSPFIVSSFGRASSSFLRGHGVTERRRARRASPAAPPVRASSRWPPLAGPPGPAARTGSLEPQSLEGMR